MTKRQCLTCKTLFTGGGSRCARCTAGVAQTRSRARQGAKSIRYDAEYRRMRSAYKNALDEGAVVTCQRCGKDVTGAMQWDLDHITVEGVQTLHPSHSTCNRRAGNR